jgi:hypothetical protein
MFIFDLNTLTYLITKLKTNFISTENLSLKVDKVEGKQLSSNNFSDEYKNKLDSKFDDVKIEKKYNSKKECLDDLVKNYPNLTRAQLSSWINRKGYRFGGKCQVLNDNEKVKEIIHEDLKKKEMLDKILQLNLGLEKGVVLSWLNRNVSSGKLLQALQHQGQR